VSPRVEITSSVDRNLDRFIHRYPTDDLLPRTGDVEAKSPCRIHHLRGGATDDVPV